MNTQTVIQKLINDHLFVAAKMHAYDNKPWNVEMLITVATGEVPRQSTVSNVMYELINHAALYETAPV